MKPVTESEIAVAKFNLDNSEDPAVLLRAVAVLLKTSGGNDVGSRLARIEVALQLLCERVAEL